MDALVERLRRAPSILAAIEVAGKLADAIDGAVGSFAPGEVDRTRAALLDGAATATSDAPTAIGSVHALGRLPPGGPPDDRNGDLWRTVAAGPAWLEAHVAWSLDRRPADAASVDRLIELLIEPGLGGLLAQRTLDRWARAGAAGVGRRLIARLDGGERSRAWADVGAEAGRARLVDTLGLVARRTADPGALQVLARIAADGDEALAPRLAAIGALGDLPAASDLGLIEIGRGDGPLAAPARLALGDRRGSERRRPEPVRASVTRGLRLAQVHLAGQLDRVLSHAGEGDTGGIATLLVQLGEALAADPRIGRVTTIGRGTASDALAGLDTPADDHVVAAVPFAAHEGASYLDPWPGVVAAERGLTRVLRDRPSDLLHLRMGDVGSLAAAEVARDEGLPFVFSLAPDPHAVIAEMEATGELDRASFGPADARTALWFRARLVRRLAKAAAQVVVFPRPALAEQLRDLVGIDILADPDRYHVVPEGVDLKPIRRARAAVETPPAKSAAATSAPAERPPVLTDLAREIAGRGPERQGLPIIVSVGRLVELKGMARLVEAFAGDPELRRRANLVIVGGALEDPSPLERAELDSIEAVLTRDPDVRRAVVLLGHRPHAEALAVLAAAASGLGTAIGGGGAYACASRKEEFGLAIVEALASGLPVVAPRIGGPATYVEDGLTGILADTLDPAVLATAIRQALDLASMAGRAARAQQRVRDRFTIEAMADALVPVYRAAVAPAASAIDGDEPGEADRASLVAGGATTDAHR